MKNTTQHVSDETDILFEDFLDNTNELDNQGVSAEKKSDISLSVLLTHLVEVKKIINSLQDQKKIESQLNIHERLEHVEKELNELKKIVSK